MDRAYHIAALRCRHCLLAPPQGFLSCIQSGLPGCQVGCLLMPICCPASAMVCKHTLADHPGVNIARPTSLEFLSCLCIMC